MPCECDLCTCAYVCMCVYVYVCDLCMCVIFVCAYVCMCVCVLCVVCIAEAEKKAGCEGADNRKWTPSGNKAANARHNIQVR